MKFFKSKEKRIEQPKVDFGWWLSNAMDSAAEPYESIGNDSGFGASETRQLSEPSSLLQLSPNCPTIVVEEEVDPECIEVENVDSFNRGALTPEGNVKYKNYRALCPTNVGIRMYSPSGDINTSPKKQKIVSKFDLLQSLSPPRVKIMQLINQDDPGSEELRAIIRPYREDRRLTDGIQRDDPIVTECWNFLQSNACSPSPNCMSPGSDANYAETLTPPPLTPARRRHSLKVTKALSVDEDQKISKVPLYFRQNSLPCEPEYSPMSLSEELTMAESRPREMTDFENDFFHEDSTDTKGTREMSTPQPYDCLDSKTAELRSFVQRNMISDSSNCDQLARLALTIEEDVEDEHHHDNSFMVAARQMQLRLHDMLKETRELQENLVDINKDFQIVKARAEHAEGEARCLKSDFRSLSYLEDVLALLRGEVDLPVLRRKWPFAGFFRRQKDPNANLIV